MKNRLRCILFASLATMSLARRLYRVDRPDESSFGTEQGEPFASSNTSSEPYYQNVALTEDLDYSGPLYVGSNL